MRSPVPEAFERLKQGIDEAEIEIQSADISMVAENTISLDLNGAKKVMRLVDILEEHDDVDAVYSNSDISDDVVSELAKE